MGFQVKEQVLDAQHVLEEQLSGRGILFNGAGDLKLPAIERAWSVDYLFDDDSALPYTRTLPSVARRVLPTTPSVSARALSLHLCPGRT